MEAQLLQTTPVRRQKRIKKPVNVHIFVPTTQIGEELLPVIPPRSAQLYVINRSGSYQYYTETELQAVAKANNWETYYVGYAIVLNEKLSLYTNDPNDREGFPVFQEFERWYFDSLERLEQFFRPPTVPEIPQETVIEASAHLQPVIPDLRAFLIVLSLIVLVGNLTQIVIAIVK